jgi:pimeloyl-ACP methyl ester carboxylesterase
MQYEIKTIKTTELQMRYFRFGQDGARPIVIIPGLSTSSVMGSAGSIRLRYAPLAEKFDIYVIDRRLDMPPVYTVEDMARDTAAAMDALGLEDALLFGVSQGGMIAQLIAARRPELAGAMALASTSSRISDKTAETVGEWVSLAERRERTALMEAFGRDVYSPAVYAMYREVLLASAAAISDEDLDRFIVQAKGTEGFDIRHELKNVRCPALVIAAGEDKVLGTEYSLETAGILGCGSFVYEGAGHGVYDEAPDYPERLLKFFWSVG